MPGTETNRPAATSASASPSPTAVAAATATATTDNNNSPSDDYAPVPPAQVAAQTAAAYDEMDAAIKETVAVAQSLRTQPPIPPAQTAAAYDEMDAAIKESVDDMNNDAPIPPPLIGNQYDAMEDAIKTSVEDNENDAPLPPSTATLDGDEENQNQKPRAMAGAKENDDAARMAAATPPSIGREANIQAQSPPSTSTPPPRSRFSSRFLQFSPPSPRMDNAERSPASSTQQSRTEDSNQASNPTPPPPQREPSAPMLELEGTLVPDIPIYDGVPVSDEVQQVVEEEKQAWLKRKQTYLFGGVGLLLGIAVTAVVFTLPTSSNNTVNDEFTLLTGSNNTVNDEFALSEPSTTSEIPSSSSRPSNTTSPSQVPSSRPSLRPSLPSPFQSPPPSEIPSKICYWIYVNIFFDEYPTETSWDVQRINDVGDNIVVRAY